jgi:hypothetical protein
MWLLSEEKMMSSQQKWLLGLSIVILMAYPLYELKSALGIDIIQGYHTPDLIKLSFRAIAP